MKERTKKLIAPIVITAVVIAYFCALAIVALNVTLPMYIVIPAVVIPLIFISLSIYALVQRIKEIRSGEEDDLSQY